MKFPKGHLNMNVGIINLSEPGLGDERLFYLLATAPKGTIIVLEDIDKAFDVQHNQQFKSNINSNATHLLIVKS